MKREEILETLAKKEKTAGTMWLLLGIYQLIVGVFTLFLGYGIACTFLGIWNIVTARKRKSFAQTLSQEPLVTLNYYKNNLSSCILFFILNLALGGFLGCLGSLYDLMIRNYALQHESELSEQF